MFPQVLELCHSLVLNQQRYSSIILPAEIQHGIAGNWDESLEVNESSVSGSKLFTFIGLPLTAPVAPLIPRGGRSAATVVNPS